MCPMLHNVWTVWHEKSKRSYPVFYRFSCCINGHIRYPLLCPDLPNSVCAITDTDWSRNIHVVSHFSTTLNAKWIENSVAIIIQIVHSSDYKKLQNDFINIFWTQVMWRAVERALGSGFRRENCEVKLVGTPLTHQRFLRRNRGTYGPAIMAGEDVFPGHSTPIPQLFRCGDSTFPGIGVPAVAASGAIVANSLVSVSQHSQLLDAIGIWWPWRIQYLLYLKFCISFI